MKKRSTATILLFRCLTLLYIAAVAYLCFANLSRVSGFHKYLFGIPADKIVHFIMFFPFPVMAFLSYDKATDTMLKAFAAYLIILSTGCIFAGLTEVIQGSLPYRSQDIKDFGADCLALAISSTLVFAYDSYKIIKQK